jgi:cytidylate kinase
MKFNVLAIDGPSGSGKSTVAKMVACKLNFNYLDTGATYRAFGYMVLVKLSETKIKSSIKKIMGTDDVDQIITTEVANELLNKFNLLYENQKVVINGLDITELIRSDEVSEISSKVATINEVREFLVGWQQNWVVGHGSSVVEGRDIGTVVFPKAPLKIFLTADDEVRSLRRSHQISQRLDTIKENLTLRDIRDSKRINSPLKAANDAIVIDSTFKSIDEVVEEILSLWKNLNL